MRSPSLRNDPAPIVANTDPMILFDEWYRSRTEGARSAHGWTPETTLFSDFTKFASACGETVRFNVDGFRDAMATKQTKTRKMMVYRTDVSGEQLEDCWDRALIRALRAV
ncbi:hypothetical protein [Sphingomonas montanisoli]|uniref:Uncharacterized protein n=1 Tax=Sphingomonas montanisoli TaxID=2606412 RepID=A0A5D9C8V8_9SPHN|nr:hypothetical protein [Sphingomonas montanisoli]TZG26481.1 hypothetical protein FYJ91_16285 [Sphingomonas montanisoli]